MLNILSFYVTNIQGKQAVVIVGNSPRLTFSESLSIAMLFFEFSMLKSGWITICVTLNVLKGKGRRDGIAVRSHAPSWTVISEARLWIEVEEKFALFMINVGNILRWWRKFVSDCKKMSLINQSSWRQINVIDVNDSLPWIRAKRSHGTCDVSRFSYWRITKATLVAMRRAAKFCVYTAVRLRINDYQCFQNLLISHKKTVN